MTSDILAAMALSAGHAPIAYEAVWSICVHLDKRREDNSNVSCESLKASWLLTRISPDVLVRYDGPIAYRPIITCVVDITRQQVLSFRIGSLSEGDQDAALAIYDALGFASTSCA